MKLINMWINIKITMLLLIIIDKMFVIYANDSYMTTKINYDDQDLTVILMVGVNGAGKTTTIAKLADMMLSEGKTVMVAAGDTFRAGAIDHWLFG